MDPEGNRRARRSQSGHPLRASASFATLDMPGSGLAYDGGAMADETQIPLAEQLEEIGAQLDWVRGYL